jgi:hypothetical protein
MTPPREPSGFVNRALAGFVWVEVEAAATGESRVAVTLERPVLAAPHVVDGVVQVLRRPSGEMCAGGLHVGAPTCPWRWR